MVMIMLRAMAPVMPLIDLWELDDDCTHPVICGNEDGSSASNPVTCGGLMLTLMALGKF